MKTNKEIMNLKTEIINGLRSICELLILVSAILLWVYESNHILLLWFMSIGTIGCCFLPTEEECEKLLNPWKPYMIWEFDNYQDLIWYIKEEIEEWTDEKKIYIAMFKHNKANIKLLKEIYIK